MSSKAWLFNREKLLGISGLALAAAIAQPVQAQTCSGVASAMCVINVTRNDQEIITRGPTSIINSATGTSIVQSEFNYLFIDNRAGSTVDSIVFAPFVPRPAFGDVGIVNRDTAVIVNSGAIGGDVVFN
ncbi:MAG: hypothetical protein AB7E60_07605 [Sphingobium sp.]